MAWKQCWPGHCVCFQLPWHSWEPDLVLGYLRQNPQCIQVKPEQLGTCGVQAVSAQIASFLTTQLRFYSNLSWLITLPRAFNCLPITYCMSKCKITYLRHIKNFFKMQKLLFTLKLNPIEITCRKSWVLPKRLHSLGVYFERCVNGKYFNTRTINAIGIW